MALSSFGQTSLHGESIPIRSFGGCDTCRMRRVKCDEGRPICSLCRAAGLSCSGYGKNIFFDSDDIMGGESVRFRRPLFTVAERKDMSQRITSSVPPRLAHWHISQIEEECENMSSGQSVEIHHGPFGAFRVSQTRAPSDSNALENLCRDTSYPSSISLATQTPNIPDDTETTQWTQSSINSVFDHSKEDLFPSSSDMWDIMINSEAVQDIFETASITDAQESSNVPQALQTYHCPDTIAHSDSTHLGSPNSIPLFQKAYNPVPEDAVFLIRHYATTLVGFMTPIRHAKTPWHILFVPYAKSCLAALTIGEQLSHTSLTAFFGTLALSASSLGGRSQSQSQMWLERAELYKQYAREQCRLMLKRAYDVPKVSKYKDILMALLTMVYLYTMTGSCNHVEYYLLEAEKFIRLKGLNRKKSRKVRLLHHCYAFQRMIYESTCVSNPNSNHRLQVRKAVELCGFVIAGQDDLSFRLHKWHNLDQEMYVLKTREEGENDLHLERPGIWSATLYPDIFGMPEILLFLLSLVIRLGKEKDAAEVRNIPDCLDLQEFLSRAKVLERSINQIRQPNHALVAYTPPSGTVDPDILGNMINAMQHALAIYFYRRIYDVDASLLQPLVVSVHDSLLRCQGTGSGTMLGSLGLKWPAFIAACEAEGLEVRHSFSNWFESSAQITGLSTFTSTLDIIRETWEARCTSNGSKVAWIDLLKKKSGEFR
ncbi:fungal-specific transcription factor domain-containing protein [Whalleya microplaca]|nr:fungal-specific transcription factor domain-containing protein [Whalleya microplaca]